jgi:hypothetical protein
MKRLVTAHWRTLLHNALFLAGMVAFFVNRPELSATCFVWAYLTKPEAKALRKNQAIVTAPVEPSSDMRQAARAMTEVRAALIASGYTSEQASRQIADMIAAQNGES